MKTARSWLRSFWRLDILKVYYMSDNLPPVLPKIGPSVPLAPQNLGMEHAQDFSVSKLEQRKERESAAVSMSRVMSGNLPGGRPSTSASHLGDSMSQGDQETRPQHSVNQVDEPDEAADYRRYSFVRRLIKKRQEEAAAEAAKHQKKGFHVGTGGSMRKTGPTGYRMRLGNLIRTKRATYKNVSMADRKLFQDTLENTLKYKRTGEAINRKDRLKMRGKFYKAHKEGKISYEDYKDFKKLIKDLD